MALDLSFSAQCGARARKPLEWSHYGPMTPVEWVLVGITALSFFVLIFFPTSRRHWPLLVFIALVAMLGLLLASMGVDIRECQRVGLDCL